MGAIMRLGKARKRFGRLKAAINDRLHQAVCGLKRRFLVRCGAGLVFCGTGRDGIMQFRVSGQETSRLSTSIVLDIGFDTQESREALARRYQVSERTVNRCRSLVSSAYMFLQEQAVVQLKARLLALLAEGQAHERCLHYSMTSFRFDETQERLALPVDPGLAPHQQESSWHVLVARRCSGFGFVLPDGSEQRLFFQSLLPNVPLTTTTAAAIYDGLWCHPVVQRLAGCIEGMALTARSGVRHFAFYVAECDQASSNSKLIAHRFDQVAQAHPGVMCAHRYCSCHEVSLVETCSVLLLGIQLINSMYSIAAVIRSRGYFVRLLRAVRQSVDKCIVVRPLSGRPSEFSMQRVYAHELADFSCSQYKVLEHIEAGASDAIRDRAISKQREKWARLLGLLNGCVWQPPGCRVEVFHNGSVDRDRLVADISKAMTDVVFSHRPGAPILKKWTKLGPSVDWFAQSMLLCSILPRVFGPAYTQFQTSGAGDSAGAHADLDADLVAGLEWASTRSSRVNRGNRFFMDSANCSQVTMAGIVLEATRFLTAFFLHHQRAAIDKKDIPGLCELATARFSPVVVALQYLSRLLSGECGGRLVLLLGPAGCDSVRSWCDRFREVSWKFRVLVTAAAAWIHDRFQRTSQAYPFKIAALGDPRLDAQEVACIAEDFKTKGGHCLPWGMAREMHRRLTVEELMTAQARQMFLRWSAMWFLSVGDIECRHARNRRAAKPGMAWTTHCNLTTAQEAAGLLAATKAQVAKVSTSSATTANESKLVSSHGRPCVRRKRAIEVFRSDRIAANKAQGLRVRVCTSSFGDQIRQDYAALPPEQKEEYERRAAATAVESVINRQVAKRARVGTTGSEPSVGGRLQGGAQEEHDVGHGLCVIGQLVPADALQHTTSVDRHLRGEEALASWIACAAPDVRAGPS